MSFCGIICEYNPLHCGHIHHINQTKKNLDIDGLICVMSGNFVQRGEPAVCDKYTRAKWAINSGADLVLELPCIFSVAPAENFAFGSVKLLAEISCVKYLSFGSEFGNLESIYDFIKNIENTNIKNKIKKGISYASSFAENDCYKSNNILAAEYLKAINKLKSPLVPFTVKREGENYNSKNINNKFSSATAIRENLYSGNLHNIKDSLPDFVYKDLCKYENFDEKLFYMLANSILTKGVKNLEKIAYISEGLQNRIYSAVKNSFDLSQLQNNIFTKRYPISKINRILINILLNITKNDVKKAKKSPLYAKVLAIKKGREDILSEISKDIKVLTRADDYKNYKNNLLNFDILANDLYAKLTLNNNINDYSKGLCKY